MQAQEIKWSYSGLKDYTNCPKQYHEVKILKNFTKKPTQEMLYGTEVHKALEDRKSTRLNSSHMSESRMPSSA